MVRGCFSAQREETNSTRDGVRSRRSEILTGAPAPGRAQCAGDLIDRDHDATDRGRSRGYARQHRDSVVAHSQHQLDGRSARGYEETRQLERKVSCKCDGRGGLPRNFRRAL